MANKLLSQLRKAEILNLPGFDKLQKITMRELKRKLYDFIKKLKINRRGLRVNEYILAYNSKFHIRADENDIEKISTDLYSTQKTEARKEYYERIKHVQNHKKFKQYMKDFMNKMSKSISFEIVIGDDEDKRLAFTESLRQLYKIKNSKVVVKSEGLSGSYKWHTLSDTKNKEITLGHISGTIDLTEDSSDTNPYVDNSFVPVRYQILFLNNKQKGKFTITKQDENNKLYQEEIEIDDKYREKPDGAFFPYVNLSDYDLSEYQIFTTINKKNYKDNCLVYAIIRSQVFSEEEIDHLRFMIKTRSIPNNLILQIAKEFKCHFIIRRIDEKADLQHQQNIKIDTRKKDWAKDFTRTVDLLLFKNHYMINKPYGNMKLITLLRKLFSEGLFRPITACEQNLLSTSEYKNNLEDYKDLNYNSELCCSKIDSTKDKKEKTWSRIYYSDFETDSTISPHKPYLNCTVYREKNQIHKMIFEGENISERLLKSLENNSLIYFHNLKYDACFFINNPDWDTQITERSGTVLQIVMTKYRTIENQKTKYRKVSVVEKRLTFRNSYSIIPSALKNFASMFNLDVHKDIMAYKLYTQKNITRRKVSALEFQIQYYEENKDKKSIRELKKDWQQLIENAKLANAYDDGKIDIMKYAIYYCNKDCVVLMKGLEKFNNDLSKVFMSTNTQIPNVHNFISISSIGYYFAYKFGCFDGCYELSGKPQDFIQRCICGGRCMTANNKKLIVEDRLQDFDAVSLYPSAMKIMNGIPKGIPKILPLDVSKDELLNLDQFFIEINIKKLKCKSDYEYKFGQIFKRNSEGSKIFDNKPVDHFYIDKVGFLDLLEFYDFEYEFIRGYYFEDGFNNKINIFIEKLFDLRLKYKKEKNPLQNTIKLLLNSIYGKSILKAITSETKSIPKNQMIKYIWKNYNYITEITENDNVQNVYVKLVKPINNHFNLVHFGASVLSWSKHIMNRVISTAEQEGISIFYQDTDSLHIREEDVIKLAEIYKLKYNKELIGTSMTQFHTDFDNFEGSIGNIYSRKLIALGKKSYLDILVDEAGNEGYHIRLKGIPKQVILNKCKHENISVEELYLKLYNGEEITFNLLDGSNCFRKTKSYQQINLPVFNRTVKF